MVIVLRYVGGPMHCSSMAHMVWRASIIRHWNWSRFCIEMFAIAWNCGRCSLMSSSRWKCNKLLCRRSEGKAKWVPLEGSNSCWNLVSQKAPCICHISGCWQSYHDPILALSTLITAAKTLCPKTIPLVSIKWHFFRFRTKCFSSHLASTLHKLSRHNEKSDP